LSRPPSLRRLLFQVVLLAAVLAGLSRLAGRSAKPAAEGDGVAPPGEATSPARPADELTTAPPDLTFYRTLGDARAPGAGPAVKPGHDGASGPPPDNASSSGAIFVVQALATHDAAAARRVRDRLAARGFPATVSTDHAAGHPVYRVRVGRYRTRAEAEAAVRVLRQKDHLDPWVLQEEE
jgi:cell division protein FtsN